MRYAVCKLLEAEAPPLRSRTQHTKIKRSRLVRTMHITRSWYDSMYTMTTPSLNLTGFSRHVICWECVFSKSKYMAQRASNGRLASCFNTKLHVHTALQPTGPALVDVTFIWPSATHWQPLHRVGQECVSVIGLHIVCPTRVQRNDDIWRCSRGCAR